MEHTATVVKTLNDLIQVNFDGMKGFQEAAEKVKNGSYKALFEQYARQRDAYLTELQDLVRSLGGDPTDHGHRTAAVHRFLLDIRAALARGDEGAILTEVERGEDAAKNAYTHALEQEALAPSVRNVLERQAEGVTQTHDHIKGLREAHKS